MSIDVSKIYEDCKKEILTNNSMFLLTKEVRTEDSGYAEWSFSTDLEKLKKYFAYAFVLVKIVKDNEKYDKDTISTTLIHLLRQAHRNNHRFHLPSPDS